MQIFRDVSKSGHYLARLVGKFGCTSVDGANVGKLLRIVLLNAFDSSCMGDFFGRSDYVCARASSTLAVVVESGMELRTLGWTGGFRRLKLCMVNKIVKAVIGRRTRS